MRKSRAAGLLFLAAAALAQQQQSVEMTSEPSHHLVFENEYVRVFDVIVAPRASTLIHRHNHDYLFVTLGDSDLVNARVGEKPAPLQLKDGEVRFTPGNFAHAAINNSDRPFHNTTIELLKLSTNVKTCTESCTVSAPCNGSSTTICLSETRLSSDQWTISMVTIPPGETFYSRHPGQFLLVAVSYIDLGWGASDVIFPFNRKPGGFDWTHAGFQGQMINHASQPARFVVLEFNEEQPKP